MAKAKARERRPLSRPRRGALAPQHASAERLELVTRAINEGVYDWDIARGTIYYSEAVYTALHMPRSVKTPAGWRRRIHPDDLGDYSRRLVEHFKGRRDRFECDYRYRDRHGAWRWARQHGIAVRDARGRAVRMVGSTGDITEMKRVERALKESQDRYALATQAATEGIYEWNLGTGSLYLSERAKEFFAVRGKALTPAAWNRRVHKDDFPGYRAALMAFFKDREAKYFEHEYRIRDAAGGYAWIVDRAVAERGGRNRVLRLIGALSDVTERKQHELELARARDEATAALEQQRATADVLSAMSSSMLSAQPVFDAIVRNLRRLFGTRFTTLQLLKGESIEMAAADGHKVIAKLLRHYPRPLDRSTGGGIAMLEKRTVQFTSIRSKVKMPPAMVAFAREFDFDSTIFTPMIHDGRVIGAIGAARPGSQPFSERQVALIKTFADQAVIAIENVRLFNETREALEQQRASAEVLGAISGSMADTQPVFDRILESCERLFSGRLIGINILGADGRLHLGAYRGKGHRRFEKIFPLPADEGSGSGAAIVRARVVHYADVENDASVPPSTRAGCAALGVKSVIFAPMLAEEGAIGAIFVGRRQAAPFSDKEIELLKGFASQAAISIKNVRLFNETKQALERQTATAEILRTIAGSPTDAQPVLEALATRAGKLSGAAYVNVLLEEGGKLRTRAVFSARGGPKADLAFTMPTSRATVNGRAFHERRVVQVEDFAAVAKKEYPDAVKFQRRFGFRTILGIPMLREGKAIGTLSVWRLEVKPFSADEIALLQTFADQAVIAIENVRLFNETKEALERQTATAEILKVIAASPANVQPVFDAIACAAQKLLHARNAVIVQVVDDMLHLVSHTETTEAGDAALKRLFPTKLTGQGATGKAVATGKPNWIVDVETDPAYSAEFRAGARARGYRSLLVVPMVREGKAIGAINVTRPEPGEFSGQQIKLLQSFADQAVIAIENVRLFNETKAALERQTATAEILKVIASSPSDVQPVFDAIAKASLRLVGGHSATVLRALDGQLRLAGATSTDPAGDAALKDFFPRPISAESAAVLASGRPYIATDTETDPNISAEFRELARARGFRSRILVPLLRDGVGVGLIIVARKESGEFSQNAVELLKTFASQAVIAIENVRLFNETREALERQTATAEILKVIASSPSDVRPVFDAIAASARRLLDGHAALVARRAGDRLELEAFTPTSEAADAALRALFPSAITGKGHMGQAILTAAPVLVSDVESDERYSEAFRASARVRGVRSVVSVPMLREGEPIGVISVNRSVPGNFSEHQTNLLRTFADQAVIAIENVRLFNETKEALEQQTATAEILKVISESPTDTQPVFDAIVKSGLRLFPDSVVMLGIPIGGKVRAAAIAAAEDGAVQAMSGRFPVPLLPDRMHAAAILEGQLIDIPDAESAAAGRYAAGVKNFLASGYRAITIAPMICGDAAIGAISVSRPKPGPLTDKQIALLKTFAAQAVIAIENVRLFKELEARTEALTRSVGQLTALREVGQAVSSTLDLETVLQSIAARAVQLTGLDSATIYEYDERTEEFHLRTAENLSVEIVAMLRDTPMAKGAGPVGRAVETGEPVEIAEMLDDSYQSPRRDFLLKSGYRALLVVPLLRESQIIGALAVSRKSPGAFAPETVDVLKTFATQSAVAIQNARLFREIAEKGRQLEVASRHKSQFLASMSHELRTPLNAILGFNEMILDEVYGELSTDVRAPLENIQSSGKHLLRLINNVLDLAKIEAGRMELALSEYLVQDMVAGVQATLRPLAEQKGLALEVALPEDLPVAYGDAGRLTQCLINLAGNSLKFTEAGRVSIAVAANGEAKLLFTVADTGIGIPPDKIGSLFTEFKQTDATIASEYGGTGLGLSITKKFIEMHGGRIWVESELGKGSAFIFEIPLRVSS
jgi:GAF domain-containing protein/PAS domain-containing protein